MEMQVIESSAVSQKARTCRVARLNADMVVERAFSLVVNDGEKHGGEAQRGSRKVWAERKHAASFYFKVGFKR